MEMRKIERAPTWSDAPAMNVTDAASYMRWLCHKRGLERFGDVMELQNSGYRGRGAAAIVLGATFGRKIGRDEYEPGAFSIPMPGANQSGLVIMETLDDDGNVIASQKIAVGPGKKGLQIDAARVRAAAGPIAAGKPARGKRARKAQDAPMEAVHGIVERHDTTPAADMPEWRRDASLAAELDAGDPIATLAARLDAIEAALSNASALEPVTIADELPAPAPAPARGNGGERDRARRLRMVRRYLAMRAQRDLDKRALMASHEHCQRIEQERDAARLDVEHYRGIALRNGKGWQETQAALDAMEDAYRDEITRRRKLAGLAWEYRKRAQRAAAIAADRLAHIVDSHAAWSRENDRANRLAGELEKSQQVRHSNAPSSDLIARVHATQEDAARRIADAEGRAKLALDRVDALAERAIRAENAMRALQARIDRAPAAYVMKPAAISFAA